jgi:hypothetical protein
MHCRTNEPTHATLAKDTKSFSHKFHQAGVTYELALSIYDDKLVHMKGPCKASQHDITIFRDELMKKTPNGKKGIGDNGYKGEKGIISTPNSRDPKELRKFKVRLFSFSSIVFHIVSVCSQFLT